jgi:hypothetical protein
MPDLIGNGPRRPVGRLPETIPNFYAYTLRVNGRKLGRAQSRQFFDCVNKIYRENHKVVYRGDKKSTTLPVFGIEEREFPKQFNDALFMMGPKARMFVSSERRREFAINIGAAGGGEFALIFRMLSNLLSREFPFSARRTAMTNFRQREEVVSQYFCNDSNFEDFVTKTGNLTGEERIIMRDYYLALLHHMDKSQYYTASFLLSTTTSFNQAHVFAWKEEEKDSTNPIIFVGWVPKNFEGILSAPDLPMLRQRMDVDKTGLPVYNFSFFPKQEEVTIKGGLLPHYLLGYIHNDKHKGELLEINPALLQTTAEWDGVGLNIDQRSFHEYLRYSSFGQYFTVTRHDQRFEQHYRHP